MLHSLPRYQRIVPRANDCLARREVIRKDTSTAFRLIAPRTTKGEKVNRSRIGLAMALGAGVGTALGVAMHNLGQGLVLGTAIGVAVGAALSRR
jgi:zinc transporter ZupT